MGCFFSLIHHVLTGRILIVAQNSSTSENPRQETSRQGTSYNFEKEVGVACFKLQGSPVFVGGSYVEPMSNSGPLFGLTHLPHTTSAAMDYGGTGPLGSGHHHGPGPGEPHPTYTDLTAHHPSQGRIQEAPKLTHL